MRIIEFVKKQASEHLGGERSLGRKALLLGGTVVLMGLSTAAALNAAVVLVLAIGMIYYLMTQVLGIKLDLDPRNLMQQAQRYASASSAPN